MMDSIASKKRFRRLIPLAFITYSLAYLDRANYGFGVAGGMGDELNITAGVSSFWHLSFSRVLFLPGSGCSLCRKA